MMMVNLSYSSTSDKKIFIDIFKTYKASPLKSREYQEKNSVKATNKKNDGHDFSGENDNEDEAFSFSNNNESPSKDLYDISYTKKSKTETQKKTNSLNESPLYNAKVNNKQEFYHPERQEKGFGQLDDREVILKLFILHENYYILAISNGENKKERIY